MSNLAKIYSSTVHYTRVREGMELRITGVYDMAKYAKGLAQIGDIVRVTVVHTCLGVYDNRCKVCNNNGIIIKFGVKGKVNYLSDVYYSSCFYELSTLSGKRISYGKSS